MVLRHVEEGVAAGVMTMTMGAGSLVRYIRKQGEL